MSPSVFASLSASPLSVDCQSTMFFHLGNKQDGSPIDLYRDTPVRLLGYANELGESFKYLISRPAYLTTYGVAIAYVLADTFDKTKRAERRQQWKVALDTLGWQMLASVAIPGLVINRVVWTTRRVMQERQLTNKLLPTYLGLACIPLIVAATLNFTGSSFAHSGDPYRQNHRLAFR